MKNSVVKLYYHHDRLGSTDYLTDNVAGKVISYVTYDDWGMLTAKANLKCGVRELDLVQEYTGHPWDAVIGLYFAEARMHDAQGRRFVAVDAIKENTSRYIYTNDNPLKYNDPWGLLIVRYGNNDIVHSFDYETGSLSIDVYSAISALMKSDSSFTYGTANANFQNGNGYHLITLQYKTKECRANIYFWKTDKQAYSYVYDGSLVYDYGQNYGYMMEPYPKSVYINGGSYSGILTKPSVSYSYFNRIMCELTGSKTKGPQVFIEDIDEAFKIMHQYLEGRILDGLFVNLAVEYAANPKEKDYYSSVKNFISGDFKGSKNATAYDTEIIAWTNFWNYRVGEGDFDNKTKSPPEIPKAMIAKESSMGTNPNEDKLPKINVMQSLVTGDYGLWTLANINPLKEAHDNGYVHVKRTYKWILEGSLPNSFIDIKNNPFGQDGLGLFRSVIHLSGSPTDETKMWVDQTKYTVRMSISGGCGFLAFKINQKSEGQGSIARGIKKYGPGSGEYLTKINKFLKEMGAKTY